LEFDGKVALRVITSLNLLRKHGLKIAQRVFDWKALSIVELL
jgi:hypothetical protein